MVLTVTINLGAGISDVAEGVGVKGNVGVMVTGSVDVIVGVDEGVSVMVGDAVNVGETYFSVNPTDTVCATEVLNASWLIGREGMPQARPNNNTITNIK